MLLTEGVTMTVAESVVREILRNPFDYSGWTIQGLGMLRLEMGPGNRERLHIWDPGSALNDVLSVHDHNWDIDQSYIYCGSMGNQRYVRAGEGGLLMQEAQVKCGVGSHLVGELRESSWAPEAPLETYGPGECYSMRAEEFHYSLPTVGTVTVISRTFRPERDVATMCWLGGGSWNQEGFTRLATKEEILYFVNLARLKWIND